MARSGDFVGYIVLDQDKPVRRPRYVNFGQKGIAIFPSMKIARRVSRFWKQRHFRQAEQFDPNLGGEQERCFNLWAARARGVRIQRVEISIPSVANIRDLRRSYGK